MNAIAALRAVEVVPDLNRQLIDAGIINGRGLVLYVLPLAPIGKHSGVVETGGPVPALVSDYLTRTYGSTRRLTFRPVILPHYSTMTAICTVFEKMC